MSCEAQCPEKMIGMCTLCGCCVADVKTQYPHNHPYAGQPVTIAGWQDNAYKAVLILSNEHTMDLTFCSSCEPDIALNLPAIWDCVLRAFKREISSSHRKILNLPPYTLKQQETVNKWMMSMLDTVPLGLLYTEKRRK